MGLFKGLVKKEAEPTERVAVTPAGSVDGTITMTQLVDLFNLGGIPSGKLSEATYFTCLKVLSEGVSKLPLKLLKTTQGQGVAEAREEPLYRLLRYRPNPFQSATLFWCDMEQDRNHWGNAYARIEGSGRELTLWRMESNRVQVWYDNAQILGPNTALWYIWSAPDGRRYKLQSEEVLHFRSWLSADGLTGLSVQEILRATLDGNLKAQQMLNKLYESGFTAKAAVQYTGDLNSELEKTFLAGLEAYATGQVDSTKNFIPIPLGARIEPLNIKLTDSQFIDIKKYSALQVAAAFGVKPNQINDYEKSSYANSETQQLAFLTDTLLWILKHYEEEIAFKLLTPAQTAAGLFPKFNTAVILRADTKTQIETMARAVSNSIYTPDEARAYLDMGSKPGGAELYANGNLIPLTQAGSQYGGRGGGNSE